MKKLLLIAVIAIAAACGVASCGEYRIIVTNPYYPYYYDARSLNLDYMYYYYMRSKLDSAMGDSNRVFTPWVPYGYQYPY